MAERPSTDDLLARLESFVSQRRASPGSAVVTGIAGLRGQTVLVIAQRRRSAAPVGVADLVLARRALEVADRLRLPLVTIVDTTGAEVSARAEEGGLAAATSALIARTMALAVPSAGVLLGDGAGAGALALLGTRWIIAAEAGWLAPLPLDGAAALLRPPMPPERIADYQRIRAPQLAEDGVVQELVPARDGETPADCAARLLERVFAALEDQAGR